MLFVQGEGRRKRRARAKKKILSRRAAERKIGVKRESEEKGETRRRNAGKIENAEESPDRPRSLVSRFKKNFASTRREFDFPDASRSTKLTAFISSFLVTKWNVHVRDATQKHRPLNATASAGIKGSRASGSNDSPRIVINPPAPFCSSSMFTLWSLTASRNRGRDISQYC